MNAELLYLKVDKVNSDGTVTEGVAFPSGTEQVVLGTYTYEAKRMGGAPTITDSFYFSRCLDKEWKSDENNSEVYAEYNGERFYVSSIPSPTKDNTNGLYKHEITLTSRREILDNTLFFDVVTEHTDTQDKDRYRSNQTKFSFGGDIREFIKRINDSLVYVGIYDPTKEEGKQGYHLVLKDGYGTDDVKEISIDSQYITEVIQEIYNTYNLTYYWKGEVCYVGEYENDLTSDDNVVRYGRNEALLSVSEENSNNKIVDMITGYGSSDNIPYYYPNDDEFGEAVFKTENLDKKLVKSISLSKVMKYQSNFYNLSLLLGKNKEEAYDANVFGLSKYIITNWQGKTYTGKGAEAKNILPVCSMGEEYSSLGSTSVSRLVGNETIWMLFEFNGISNDKVKLDGLSFVAAETDDALKFGLTFKYEHAYYICEGSDAESVLNIIDSKTRGGGTIGGSLSGNTSGGTFGGGTTTGSTSSVWSFGDDIEGLNNYTKSSAKEHTFVKSGKATVVVACKVTATNIEKAKGTRRLNTVSTRITGDVTYTHKPDSVYYFEYGDHEIVSYEDSGIELSDIDSITSKDLSFAFDGTDWIAAEGDTDGVAKITITDRIWFDPSQNLMPSIYRESKGAERFYYALNDTHKIPGSDKYYEFKNKYVKGNPHQGSTSFDDIKPTINGIRNDVIQSDGLGQLFGEIADVAFDSKDSDVKDSNDEYVHQYFYIKLHKFSGEFGFDLFSHALAKENAVINMIDCQGCPACAFPIKTQPNADNSKMFNCVSTDGNGNLVSLNTDKDDYILSKDAALNDKLNQNSQEKEIWIAVQKDNSTLGIVMPNAAGNFKPKKGDKFVITGIKPPKVLVTAAEHRLDEALIKYMSENNEDSFTYSIKFSRIFLAENPDYANKLNENAKICLEFNGVKHELFVSNYSVKRDGKALAEVEVELVKSLEVTQSEMKQMIDSVKGDVMNSIGSGLNTGSNNSFNAATADKMYLSKLKDDTAAGTITFEQLQKFLKGISLGTQGSYGINGNGAAILSLLQSLDFDEVAQSGFSISKMGTGKYKMLISALEVWGKAIFHELEVRKLSYVGGDFIFSPAGSKLVRVVPVYKVSEDGNVSWTDKQPTSASSVDGWKCYLLADDGSTATMNMWKKGDQAQCKTFNIKAGVYENVSNRYYWRLVEEVSTENETISDDNGNVLYDGMGFAWVILSAADYDESMDNDVPAADDTIVCLGNRTDTDRQNIIMIATQGDAAPYIAGYKNVFGYYLNKEGENHTIFKFSVKGTVFASDSVSYVNYNGSQFTIPIYRGEWKQGETYFYNEQVDHEGTLWQCHTGNSEGTTDEPSEDSVHWRALTDVTYKRLSIELNGQESMDWGETVKVVCSVTKGDKVIDTSSGWEWAVTRSSGNKTEDEAWNVSSKAKAFAGSIELSYTSSENDLGEEREGVFGTVFTFYAWEQGNKVNTLSAELRI